ncbi:response regulator transcription factor [Segnochrobactraceae bacterium EtOH-i3]
MTENQPIIAVIDDEPDLARLIERTLTEHWFAVRVFSRGRAFLAEADQMETAAAIVDLGLPDMDGLDLVRTLAARGIAVLVLTGRGGVADRVLGLELGADDYLVKPFEPRELVARLRSVLRRTGRSRAGEGAEPPAGAVVDVSVAAFAGWRFDAEALLLTDPAGESRRLSRAEAKLLDLFVRAPNRVLSRDFLLEARGAGQTFDRSIDVRISRLRQKLDDDPQNPRFIRTVYGMGYLFAEPVAWGPR